MTSLPTEARLLIEDRGKLLAREYRGCPDRVVTDLIEEAGEVIWRGLRRTGTEPDVAVSASEAFRVAAWREWRRSA